MMGNINIVEQVFFLALYNLQEISMLLSLNLKYLWCSIFITSFKHKYRSKATVNYYYKIQMSKI